MSPWWHTPWKNLHKEESLKLRLPLHPSRQSGLQQLLLSNWPTPAELLSCTIKDKLNAGAKPSCAWDISLSSPPQLVSSLMSLVSSGLTALLTSQSQWITRHTISGCLVSQLSSSNWSSASSVCFALSKVVKLSGYSNQLWKNTEMHKMVSLMESLCMKENQSRWPTIDHGFANSPALISLPVFLRFHLLFQSWMISLISLFLSSMNN